jgi:predicted nucleic acid-binding protein
VSTFVDTSALFAFLDKSDARHADAVRWLSQISADEQLVTHAFVMVESSALIQRRLGIPALRIFHNAVAARLDVDHVGASLYEAGIIGLLAAASPVSLVDHVSFELMRRRGLRHAFAFDADFATAGFETVP